MTHEYQLPGCNPLQVLSYQAVTPYSYSVTWLLPPASTQLPGCDPQQQLLNCDTLSVSSGAICG